MWRLFLIALLAGACCGSYPLSARADELTVSAAVSLKEVLSQLGHEFESQHKGTRVFFNFGSSGELARQIEQGADVDIFASASDTQMNLLGQMGLVDKRTIKTLVHNRLVVVAPSSAGCPKALADLSKLTRIAVGNPATVPAGQYARQALDKAGIWSSLEAGHKLVFGESVRQVLAYAEGENVDAALVYKTDVRIAHNIKICLNVPSNLTGTITYPIAVVQSSKHKQLAEQLARYFLSADARQVLARAGYELP